MPRWARAGNRTSLGRRVPPGDRRRDPSSCYRACWIDLSRDRFTWPVLRFRCPLLRSRSRSGRIEKNPMCRDFLTYTGVGGESPNSGLRDVLLSTPCSTKTPL